MFPARSKITVSIAIGAIVVLANYAQAATITWNGDGDGSSWHDADNWDLNQVPVAGDDVIIPDVVPTTVVVFSTGTTAINSLDCVEPFELTGGTLDIAATTAFNNTYTQNAGLLTGTSDVVVSELTRWNGGEIEGTTGTETFTANMGMEVGSGNDKNLDNRILHFSGTANWTDGDIRLFNGAVFNVGATDTFNALADDHSLVSFNNGNFNNAGIFVVDVTNSISFAIDFLNTGTVDVKAGTLNFSSNTATHTAATITVANGALLQFSGGTHDLDAATTLDATDVLFSGGTVNMDGTYTLSGSSTTVSGGTVNFTGSITNGVVGALTITAGTANFSNTEGSITAETYTQTSGKLTGTSDVVVSGLTRWDGGEIEGTTGTETFTANMGMALGSDTQKVLDNRILSYSGTANWTDGDIRFFNGAVFNVGATETFNALADDHRLFTDGTFNNRRDLRGRRPQQRWHFDRFVQFPQHRHRGRAGWDAEL